MKYSASEIDRNKSITLIETKPGNSVIKTLYPLQLSRDFVRIEGTFDQLVSRDFRMQQNLEHYFYIVLDDEQEIFDAYEKLHAIYPRILSISYAHLNREHQLDEYTPIEASHQTPQMIIARFFEFQNGTKMDEDQTKLIETCWEALHETH